MKLSIITVNYNNKVGLENTIKSVINQTNKDFEYILIDGNSTDGSKDVIENYKNAFSYSVSEPDSGVYNAMNKGIKASKGNYVFFLNSGDTFYNKDVLKSVSQIITNNIDIYYGDLVLNNSKKKITTPATLKFSYFLQKTIPHQSALIKKSLFDRVFYYNENLKIVSDWEFFICAICVYNASYKYVDIIISYYDTNGISSIKENRSLFCQETELCLNKHFPLFIDDYKKLKKFNNILNSNRFKMLLELENSKVSKKINSILLRLLLRLFRNKSLKDLKK